jgi:hypothetical protein
LTPKYQISKSKFLSNAKGSTEIKNDRMNFSKLLDKSDSEYTPNYKTRSNLRDYYDSNIKDISTDLKSTFDQSHRQSRTKSADKLKNVINKVIKSNQRNHSSGKITKGKQSSLKNNDNLSKINFQKENERELLYKSYMSDNCKSN